MTINELRSRSVINVRDASDYGCPTDFRLIPCDGSITHILVNRSTGFLPFGSSCKMEIPWCAVVRIGDGAILVDVPTPVKCDTCEKPPKKRNPFF